MYLVVKLRFEFLSNYFPQHEALCSNFAIIPEIPQTARSQFRLKPTSSDLDVEAKLIFLQGINIPLFLHSRLIFLLSMHQHQPIRYSSVS